MILSQKTVPKWSRPSFMIINVDCVLPAFFYLCLFADRESEKIKKWIGSTVTSASWEEDRSLLCPAVATSAAKHALNPVRALCFINSFLLNCTLFFFLEENFLTCKRFHMTNVPWCIYVFPPSLSEQCSVCGANCNYLALNDEVSEFDLLRKILIHTACVLYLDALLFQMKPQQRVFFKDPVELIQSRLAQMTQVCLIRGFGFSFEK